MKPPAPQNLTFQENFKQLFLARRRFWCISGICMALIAEACTAGNVIPATSTSAAAVGTSGLSPASRSVRIHSLFDGNQCVDTAVADSVGTLLTLDLCGSSASQSWLFQDNHFLSATGQCVGPVGASSMLGAALQLKACSVSDNTLNWSLSGNQLRMANTTMCVGLSATPKAPNSRLQLQSCDGPQNTLSSWTFETAVESTSTNASSDNPQINCPDLPNWSVQAEALEAAVFTEINAARALGADCHTAGKKPPQGSLKRDTRLVCIARNFAKTMSDKNFFSHVGPDGKGPFDRMTQAGINWRAGAENIALGPLDAPAVVKGWLGSDGHCADLMGDYTLTGIGYFNSYWVQDFATEF